MLTELFYNFLHFTLASEQTDSALFSNFFRRFVWAAKYRDIVSSGKRNLTSQYLRLNSNFAMSINYLYFTIVRVILSLLNIFPSQHFLRVISMMIKLRWMFHFNFLMLKAQIRRRIWVPRIKQPQCSLNDTVYFCHSTYSYIATHKSFRNACNLLISPRL